MRQITLSILKPLSALIASASKLLLLNRHGNYLLLVAGAHIKYDGQDGVTMRENKPAALRRISLRLEPRFR